MAQGMKPFQAACAGVWLHAESGRVFGPGLVAEDITEMLPSILRKIIL
jgi:NAD(P)H-hydrate epimerase